MPCEHHEGCPIAPAQRAFRARIEAQLQRAEQFLAENRSSDEEKAAGTGASLGTFAGGRIDAARFQSLLAAGHRADPATLDAVDAAASKLRDLADRIDEMTKITCPPGGVLRDTVAGALALTGLVFGAARVIELARGGRFRAADHMRLLEALPYASWSPTERGAVPWMRVIVDGADLHAASLAEFLDGGLHVVLKVRGPCAPAPLARLASPGTYVAQVAGKADLDAFKSFEGPAVAAFVPEGAARFTHDPRRGPRPYDRFEIADPPRAPRTGVGGVSATQMAEDVAMLETLSRAPSTTGDARGGAPKVDPADKLASWLLHEAGLKQ